MINKIKINIVGKDPKYFFKELIKQKINIYYQTIIENNLQIIIDYKDYLKLKEMKTTYKITILKRYGLNKYQNFLKNNLILIFFSLLAILINIVLSNIVFKIEVEHYNKEIVKLIKKDLESLGIKKYHFKVSYKEKEKIKEQILNKEKSKIEWLEIEEIGTKYLIKVEQRKQQSKEKNCPLRHIVSKKNALVTEIKATNGEIVKKKNDYVSKGEIIISGLIHNKEEIVSKKCATGTVYGEVWYTVKVTLPKIINKTVSTTKSKTGLSIKVLSKEYNFFNKFKNFQKNAYNIIDSDIVPLNISLVKYNEQKKVKKKANLKQLEKQAIQLAEKKLLKTLNSDVEITSKKVLKKKEINSKIVIEVFFKAKENITAYQEIKDIELEEKEE